MALIAAQNAGVILVGQSSDRYILFLFHIHAPPPFASFQICLTVSVDVKHHVYLLPQSWLDKRGLGLPSYGGFGRPLGDANRYFNWKDYLAAGISKRQLNYGPRSFGNFQRYFTNGLQDWRSTYTGGMKKREAPKETEPSA